jgi:peptide/nickel transport system substrate-binding protein
MTACGGGGAGNTNAGNELRVGRTGSIDGMSGDSCLGPASIQTMPMIYGSLLVNTPDGQGITGGLASDFKYDDKALTYTLPIRPEAKFSNGSAVTANDVVFSINEWRKGTVGGGYYEMIKGASAIDEHTVRIDLKRPDTFLPALLTWCTSTVYPANYAGSSPEEFFKKPIGAGPYQVDSWQNPGASEQITLSKNPNFYIPQKPSVDKIVITSSTDSAQQTLAYQSGQLDVIEQIGADDAPNVPSAEVIKSKPSQSMDLFLNKRRPVLADERVRQAISLAVNRADIATIQDGFVTAAVGVIPTNVPNSVAGSNPQRFDLDAAKKLMAEANPGPVNVTLAFEGGSSTVSNVANLIRDQLGKIGVTVTLRPSDSATIYDFGKSGDYDILMSTVTAISPTAFDPIGFLVVAWYPWTGSDMSVIQPEYTRGISTFDDAAKNAAVAAIQDDATKQSTLVGLYNQVAAYAVKPYVKGINPLPYRMWDAAQVQIERTGSA